MNSLHRQYYSSSLNIVNECEFIYKVPIATPQPSMHLSTFDSRIDVAKLQTKELSARACNFVWQHLCDRQRVACLPTRTE